MSSMFVPLYCGVSHSEQMIITLTSYYGKKIIQYLLIFELQTELHAHTHVRTHSLVHIHSVKQHTLCSLSTDQTLFSPCGFKVRPGWLLCQRKSISIDREVDLMCCVFTSCARAPTEIWSVAVCTCMCASALMLVQERGEKILLISVVLAEGLVSLSSSSFYPL